MTTYDDDHRPVSDYQAPQRRDLERGARYGQHTLRSVADDKLIQRLVEAIFDPRPLFPGLPTLTPCADILIDQLLAYAPRPRTGMEGPDTRGPWLRRADELCSAWDRHLLGPGGLRPNVTLADQ